MAEEIAIRLTGIHTRLGGHEVHRGIDLEVRRGEVLALVGGSGSGKTTLLREMIGLLRPSEGEVEVFGESPLQTDEARARRLRRRWGVLFQHGALFTALNVFDNIALPLREMRVRDEQLIARLVALKLAMVGLAPEDAARMPAELSGGMVKRVGLARALSLEPELLLLDEPTSGLDPVAGQQFVELIGGLCRELGLTVVRVTHDLDMLVDICDRIAVLADGRLVAVAPLVEVMQVAHPFIKTYFHGARARRTLAGVPVGEQ